MKMFSKRENNYLSTTLFIKQGESFPEVRSILQMYYHIKFSGILNKKSKIDVIILDFDDSDIESHSQKIALTRALIFLFQFREDPISLMIGNMLAEEKQNELEKLLTDPISLREDVTIKMNIKVSTFKEPQENSLKDLMLNYIATHSDEERFKKPTVQIPTELKDELNSRERNLSWKKTDEQHILCFNSKDLDFAEREERINKENTKCYKQHFKKIVNDNIERIILAYDTGLELDNSLPWGLMAALQSRTKPIEIIVSADLLEKDQQWITQLLQEAKELYSEKHPSLGHLVSIVSNQKIENNNFVT